MSRVTRRVTTPETTSHEEEVTRSDRVTLLSELFSLLELLDVPAPYPADVVELAHAIMACSHEDHFVECTRRIMLMHEKLQASDDLRAASLARASNRLN